MTNLKNLMEEVLRRVFRQRKKVYCMSCGYEDSRRCTHPSCFTGNYFEPKGARITDCEKKNKYNDCKDYIWRGEWEEEE